MGQVAVAPDRRREVVGEDLWTAYVYVLDEEGEKLIAVVKGCESESDALVAGHRALKLIEKRVFN